MFRACSEQVKRAGNPMVSGPFYANEDQGVSLLIRVYQLPREVRVPLQVKPVAT